MTLLTSVSRIRESYLDNSRNPHDVITAAQKAASQVPSSIWTNRFDVELVAGYVDRLSQLDPDSSKLWGVPFAIKDNIDLAGVPTTAGCPEFSYTPTESAEVVKRILAAGGIPIGKTNLDQFATGLTGTRSPYGVVENPADPKYLAGGSSSGSAVAVKMGVVPFALGTDTAGSGRVPAAFNGIYGYKPTRGLWSTRGIVPACRTLDCPSVFANSISDIATIAYALDGFDAKDSFSRAVSQSEFKNPSRPRVGYLPANRIPWFGDQAYESAYREFVDRLPSDSSAIQAEPFLEAGRLLYEGPWVAERVASVGGFIRKNPSGVMAVTREVINGGRDLLAVDYFKAHYRLQELRREVDDVFESVDVLLMPTTPTHYTIEEVSKDPIGTNTRLGTFSQCANLLDLCALAFPAGLTKQRLPFGMTAFAPAGFDFALLTSMSNLFHENLDEAETQHMDAMEVAVCGAHMSGQPLNEELLGRGAKFVATSRTAQSYRLFALPDGKRPVLVPVETGGQSIEVEIWSLPINEVGGFMTSILPPIGIGHLELENGEQIRGCIGDASTAKNALDITAFGGWRNYLSSR